MRRSPVEDASFTPSEEEESPLKQHEPQQSRTRPKRIYTPCSILPWVKPGRASTGLIRKFKSQVLTGGDGHGAWQALMDRYKIEGGEILRRAMSKFMNLKLKGGKDSDILFYGASWITFGKW